MRRVLAAIAVVTLVAACGRFGGGTPTPTAGIGRPVGVRMLALSRQARSLPTTVWYPATSAGKETPAAKDSAPYPLVVFAHGLRGLPDDYAKLLASWAGHGYVVAAPAFPFTSRGGDINAADLTNQPADVSAVITALIGASNDASSPLAGMVDPKRIIAAGHSEGALTTVTLFAQCCAETRLSGAIVLAGDNIGTEGKPFTAPPKPLLYVHGDDDKIINIALGRRSYDSAPEPKAFITLLGAGHIDPYASANATGAAADVVREATADFLAFVTGDAGAKAALDTVGSRAGVAKIEDHLR